MDARLRYISEEKRLASAFVVDMLFVGCDFCNLKVVIV